MKTKRILISVLAIFLLFTLVSCGATPLPAPATPTEIKAMKADEKTSLTCLYLAREKHDYTADSIWIDPKKEELLLYESEQRERLLSLERDMNIALEPYPISQESGTLWEFAKTMLDLQDSTVDLVLHPYDTPIPTEMTKHFVKTSELLTENGSAILGSLAATDPYSVTGKFSLSAISEEVVLFMNLALLENESALKDLPALIAQGSFTFEEFVKLAKLPLSDGKAPLVTTKEELTHCLVAAFSAKTDDDRSVQNAIDTLENEQLAIYESDPAKAFAEGRALFVFAPLADATRVFSHMFEDIAALPLPKSIQSEPTYHAIYSKKLDSASISRYSEKKELAAATLAYLGYHENEIFDAFFRDLYACRCNCIRKEIWQKTAKVYETNCIFRLIALDKGEKG